MRYGESSFDILYLLIAIISGLVILSRSRGRLGRLMGWAVLVLGCGDAFHLVPRVLNYFLTGDFSFWLGGGKLVTSLTMTVFYVCMYYIWLENYGRSESKGLTAAVWLLAALRVALCLFPQNGWFGNEGPLFWGILRNIPFLLLGLLIVLLYFRERSQDRVFKYIWLYVLLSFLFYIPVVVGADSLPMLGMLMLPKTVCYILIIFAFLRKSAQLR